MLTTNLDFLESIIKWRTKIHLYQLKKDTFIWLLIFSLLQLLSQIEIFVIMMIVLNCALCIILPAKQPFIIIKICSNVSCNLIARFWMKMRRMQKLFSGKDRLRQIWTTLKRQWYVCSWRQIGKKTFSVEGRRRMFLVQYYQPLQWQNQNLSSAHLEYIFRIQKKIRKNKLTCEIKN